MDDSGFEARPDDIDAPRRVPVGREGNFIRFVPSAFVVRALPGETVRFDILLRRYEERDPVHVLDPDAPPPNERQVEMREVAAIEVSRDQLLELRQTIDRAVGEGAPLIDHARHAEEARLRDLVGQVEAVGHRVLERIDTLGQEAAGRDRGAQHVEAVEGVRAELGRVLERVETLGHEAAGRDRGVQHVEAVEGVRAELGRVLERVETLDRDAAERDRGTRHAEAIEAVRAELGKLNRVIPETVADALGEHTRVTGDRIDHVRGELRAGVDALPGHLAETVSSKLLPALDQRLETASSNLAAPTAAIARETLDRLDLVQAAIERMRRAGSGVARDAIMAGAIIVALAALAVALVRP